MKAAYPADTIKNTQIKKLSIHTLEIKQKIMASNNHPQYTEKFKKTSFNLFPKNSPLR